MSDPLHQLLECSDGGDDACVASVLDADPEIVSGRGSLPGHSGNRTALHFAVSGRHASVVRLLLDRGADPNVRDEGDNAMPLHFAAEIGDMGMIEPLLAHGADPVGAGDTHELEVIGWATCFGAGRGEVVQSLLDRGARHNICSAVATGDTQAIRDLVERRPADLEHVMDRANRNRRPLHLAAVKKQRESLETLLDLGADVDSQEAAGFTPLDEAALAGEHGMADLLIHRGARIQLPAAVLLGRTDDVQRLIREDPVAVEPAGRWGMLLIRASERGSRQAIERLIEMGADVNHADKRLAVDDVDRYTPLHAAAYHGNGEGAAALLALGADVRIRDSRYHGTPAGWANYAGHKDVRDVILDGPIDIFDAIEHDRAERIPDMVASDPEALTRTFGGYAQSDDRPAQWWPTSTTTPLEWAIKQKNHRAVNILRSLGA
jgi:ankyrin repeat protein